MFEGTGYEVAAVMKLPGFRTEHLEFEADGTPTMHVVSAPGTVRRCPGCGTESCQVKERVAHTARHFAMIPLRVTLHQQTLICGNEECPRGSFVEDVAFTAPGGRVTLSALDTMGHLVGDGVVAVDVVARWAGMSWHTMHGGFIAIAEQAGITVTDPSFAAEALAEAVLANEQLADPDLADPDLGDEVAGGAAGPVALETTALARALATEDLAAPVGPDAETRGWPRSVFGPLPEVRVLGMDDQRRGRRRAHTDASTDRWVSDADCWQTVLIDSTGGHGLRGAIEGRLKNPVIVTDTRPAGGLARLDLGRHDRHVGLLPRRRPRGPPTRADRRRSVPRGPATEHDGR